jgi:hypothetical protein
MKTYTLKVVRAAEDNPADYQTQLLLLCLLTRRHAVNFLRLVGCACS